MQEEKHRPVRNRKILFLGILLGCALTFAIHHSAEAAVVYLAPSSGSYDVGNIINVDLIVNTQGVAINNAEATLNFPTDLLEAVSISKSGSIFSLWVTEPSFSNNSGTIDYNGGLPTPGFTGANGKIISIIFRAKKEGTASVLFASATVRANDGLGTDILSGKISAQFTLVVSKPTPVPAPAPEPAPTPPPQAVAKIPAAPVIFSPTHPDSDKWYNIKDATFSWSVGSDITADRLSVGRISSSQPNVVYRPPVRTKTIKDLDDGVWYFNVQLSNSSGWGGITRFRFQIDTENPAYFNIQPLEGSDLLDSKARFKFDAVDKLSGIDYYKIQIDDEKDIIWRDTGAHIYETPALGPGKHLIVAKAVDKAGNYLTDSVEFNIIALQPPVITEYPQKLDSSETLVIKGGTYPNTPVIIWLQRSNENAQSFTVKSDEKGTFVFVLDRKLEEGRYQIWAVTVYNNIQSGASTTVEVVVIKSMFVQIRTKIINLFTVATPIIIVVAGCLLLIIGLLLIILHIMRKFAMFKRKLRKEAREAERTLRKSFNSVREQLWLLEKLRIKRGVNVQEKKVIKQLKQRLDNVEDLVGKEIEDIEKNLK